MVATGGLNTRSPGTTTPVKKASTATDPAEKAEKSEKSETAPIVVLQKDVPTASVPDSVVSPPAGDPPTAPVDSPATVALLAAARRETSSTTTASASIATAKVAVATPSVAPPFPYPTNVVAIPQAPPLAFLQQIPIVGPVFVTPIVTLIHQIPLVSDIVHPFVGYPVQFGLPAGSPTPRDVKVVSFDGTQIYVHFIPALGLAQGQKAPTILEGPGLPLPGATNLDGALLDDVITDALGQVSLVSLRRAGYNVVTWDPRGEYNSGGVLQVDSPDFEARDVSSIISWVAQQSEVELDSPNDPRIGMVGVSYGGGIQLVTAAIDHRVDAIVPTIAWNSLNTSLYKDGAFKSSWGSILASLLVLTGARPNPDIFPAVVRGDLTGVLTQAEQDLLADRGPGGPRNLVNDITTPTLLIQGTVDTLFTLQEADANARALIANGVPTKVLWFCGGHGLCGNDLFDLTDGALIQQRTIEWLDRYVKGVTSVDTGPQFEWVDQRGQYFSLKNYPLTPGPSLLASTDSAGTLPLIPILGGSLPGFLFAGSAANALNVKVPAPSVTTYVVGAPQLTMTYSGTGSSRHVYAQLVDDSTGRVLGSQVTPIPVTLDGQTHTLTIALEQVAHTLAPGETLTLQLVASTGTYAIITAPGVLNVSNVQLALPTAPGAVARSPQPAAAMVRAT